MFHMKQHIMEYNILNLYHDKRFLFLKERLSYLNIDHLNNKEKYNEQNKC